MKKLSKVLVIIFAMSLMFLTGCGSKEETKVDDSAAKQEEASKNMQSTEKADDTDVIEIEDVIEIPNMSSTSKERVGYSTQKPKELLEILIKQSSNEGDVIADFFVGSGTSMVVAKELGRRYIGCDINPKAVEITNKRLEE